jgi:hypothetical protein
LADLCRANVPTFEIFIDSPIQTFSNYFGSVNFRKVIGHQELPSTQLGQATPGTLVMGGGWWWLELKQFRGGVFSVQFFGVSRDRREF